MNFCNFIQQRLLRDDFQIQPHRQAVSVSGQAKTTSMKLNDIFTDTKTKVFVVTNQDDENEINWTIEATDFELIPEEENYYFVKALQVSADSTTDCFIGIMTPERIAETVVKKNINGQAVTESICDQKHTIIPAVASDCFGNYEMFYAKENPQIGIDILKNGLTKAINKNVAAEDLGYILRDEGRVNEAIEAFKISEENGPSSEYTYLELAGLYEQIGQTEKQLEYKQKYKDNGGLDL
jgi:tetratricopeptide (TPR) repeat protein